ncbi:MAG: zf-HC2 domain-containing protein [Gammaproteobacteria bacterium]|nr:zf-HC2 domain-containing protein [Gammaproteobacteria bacterium]
MKCKDVVSQIEDFVDDELSTSQHDLLRSHFESCGNCYQSWQQELIFRQVLKQYPLPPARAGLDRRAFSKLPRRPSVHKNAFIAGFGTAMAAAIVLAIAASLFLPQYSQQPVANIVLTLYESKKVNMVFDVPEQVADATVSLHLPEHIEIGGRQGLHQIEWKTALKKGKNMLSLPIVAKMATAGELVAKIKYGKQEKVFRLKLDIQKIEQGLTDSAVINRA